MSSALARDLAEVDEHGFVVLSDVLTRRETDAVRAGLDPLLAQAPTGRNEFEGHLTQRVYSLLAKTRAVDILVEHPRVLAICDRVLTDGCLLSAALTCNVLPGGTPQPLHADGQFYGVVRPRPPIGISTMWAIDDFTAENGATLAVPGSHRWDDRAPDPSTPTVCLAMPGGSVAIFPDTLWHGAGANRSERQRLGLTIQYCAPWARQIENMVLAVPPDTARMVSPRIRSLIGYSIHPPFVGYVDGRHPERLLGIDTPHP